MKEEWMRIKTFSRFLFFTTAMFTLLLIPLAGGVAHAQQAPVLQSLNSQAPAPGAKLTVTHQNFSAINTWTAVVELQSGEKFEQAPVYVSNTQFKVPRSQHLRRVQRYREERPAPAEDPAGEGSLCQEGGG